MPCAACADFPQASRDPSPSPPYVKAQEALLLGGYGAALSGDAGVRRRGPDEDSTLGVEHHAFGTEKGATVVDHLGLGTQGTSARLSVVTDVHVRRHSQLG
jgi:hypothetical protein